MEEVSAVAKSSSQEIEDCMMNAARSVACDSRNGVRRRHSWC